MKTLPIGKRIYNVDEILVLPEPYLIMTSQQHTTIRFLNPDKVTTIRHVTFIWRYKLPILFINHDGSIEIVKPRDIRPGAWFCRRRHFKKIVEFGTLGNLVYENGYFNIVNPFDAPPSSIPLIRDSSNLIFVATPTEHGLFTIEGVTQVKLHNVNFMCRIDNADTIYGYLSVAGDILLYHRDSIYELMQKQLFDVMIRRPLGRIVGVVTMEDAL